MSSYVYLFVFFLLLAVLESVQKFIPEIAKANAKLSQENLPDLNMENISENDDKVIEMVTMITIFYNSISSMVRYKTTHFAGREYCV